MARLQAHEVDLSRSCACPRCGYHSEDETHRIWFCPALSAQRARGSTSALFRSKGSRPRQPSCIGHAPRLRQTLQGVRLVARHRKEVRNPSFFSFSLFLFFSFSCFFVSLFVSPMCSANVVHKRCLASSVRSTCPVSHSCHASSVFLEV